MPIPLVIINSFNVLFSVLVFFLLFSFRFFFLPHFIALSLTSATNISGEVPFLSLVPVRRPPRLSRSTYFGDVADTNGRVSRGIVRPRDWACNSHEMSPTDLTVEGDERVAVLADQLILKVNISHGIPSYCACLVVFFSAFSSVSNV